MPGPLLYTVLAPHYDQVYRAKEYRREAERLLSLARRALGHRPRSVLDVACGTGRHLEAFRRRVPRIAGVDASAAMLREARHRLGPGVVLVRGDMRRFRIPQTFDLVVCLFSSVGYLRTAEDRRRTLRRFFHHLEPGGVALVEGWVRPNRWNPRNLHLQTSRKGELTIVRLSSSGRRGAKAWLDMHYLLARPGGRIRHVHEVHRNLLVSDADWLRSFRGAGFRPRVVHDPAYVDRALILGVRPRVSTSSEAA